jgi:hypothetical protein
MSREPRRAIPEEGTGNLRLATILAMAMFVLVVETSLMPT